MVGIRADLPLTTAVNTGPERNIFLVPCALRELSVEAL
jgi:hypothetical protein